jgi:hypothetical protein
MKRRENILRADRCYAAREKLEKRETRYFVGLLGSLALIVPEFVASDVRVAGVRDALIIGRDVGVVGGVSFAMLGLCNSIKQSHAKDYVRMLNGEFRGITGALAAEPESLEGLQLMELDSAFTELCGSAPVTSEDLE